MSLLEGDFVEIPDTLKDERMADNPLCTEEPGFRFYAGAVLVPKVLEPGPCKPRSLRGGALTRSLLGISRRIACGRSRSGSTLVGQCTATRVAMASHSIETRQHSGPVRTHIL